MKKCLCLIFALLLFPLPVQAVEIPEEVTAALPEETASWLLSDRADYRSFQEGIRGLWEQAARLLPDMVRQAARGAAKLLLVILLCAVAENGFAAAGAPVRILHLAGVLAAAKIALSDMDSLIGMSVSAMDELDVFSKALLPTLSAAASAGGAVSAGVRQVITLFFSDLLLTLIRGVLLPLVYFYIAAVTADAMLPEHRLKRIGEGIRRGVTWLLTGAVFVFTAWLSLSGTAASAADAAALQLTRTAISTAVPVVGSMIAEAGDSVLAAANVLKNTVGIFGLLAVIGICLEPFVRLGVQYLLFKLTAFAAEIMGGDTLAGLLDGLSRAFALLLGMTGSCALTLLIAVAVFLRAVTGN